MSKRILFQFDCDPQPSSFDAVVAIDSGIDHLVSYGDVQPTSIEPLVHGTMFTRGGEDLKNTAIFLGGSDVMAAENLLRCVKETFFGPVRVSVMMDANGCNTTAAAAVVAAARHLNLAGSRAVVLGGTGPVGQRVGRLLVGQGATVVLTSRSKSRAEKVCKRIARQMADGDAQREADIASRLEPAELDSPEEVSEVLSGAQVVIACGAAGVELVSHDDLRSVDTLAVAIDLNAVPPSGLGGVAVTDKGKPLTSAGSDASEARTSALVYGAIGVGGLKMKTHRAAIASLFESNDQVLDADEIHAIAKRVDGR